MSNLNISMIQDVARALGHLREEVVFVGGASVSLYLNLDTADEVRPTEDVDVIIEIATKAKYQLLSEKLIKMKFKPDTTMGAPICRWKYLGMTIDIMPIEESILGFSNNFYKSGFKEKESIKLPDGQDIFILPIGLFLATKFEAFFSRGYDDPRLSSDLEDIVALILDANDFDLIFNIKSTQSFLNESFNKILISENCMEAVRGFLQGAPSGAFELFNKRVQPNT